VIPRVVHYCWFGRNPKPTLAEKCIQSWKKYCPDYDIIEWNEDNFDLSACPLYVRQAYEAKKWAFVTDYVRLKVVYDHGGIYMDTDVELKKSLEPLLGHRAYFGFEDGVHIATGLGFGAEKGNPVVYCMLKDYDNAVFCQPDGTVEYVTCPARNTASVSHLLGEDYDGSHIVMTSDAVIYPTEYFCPLNWKTKILAMTENTYSVHWYDASWLREDQDILNEYLSFRGKLEGLLGKRVGNFLARTIYKRIRPRKWKIISRM